MNGSILRLGLVGPLPPPNGGMAMQTMQLADLLSQEGINVELVQTNSSCSLKFIERIRGLRALVRLVPYIFRVWWMAGRVDVIHLMANSGWSWQFYAAPVVWIGWLRKTAVIVNYRGGEAKEYLSASENWVRPTLAKASALVVPSEFLQQVFSDFGIRADVVPNIIDLATFFPAAKETSSTRFTVVITRNLEPIYGLDTAIRAIAIAHKSMPNVCLKIAGSGPQKAELEQLVETLNLSDVVFFLGRLGRAEIVDLYHGADVMLNPTNVDNMPNSILEAMACGVPVISTNVGGVPFMVRDGETGLLIAPGREQEMAEAIVGLSKDATARDILAKNGRSEVTQYSWENVKPLWLALYSGHGVVV